MAVLRFMNQNFREIPYGHENSTPWNQGSAWAKPSEIQSSSTKIGHTDVMGFFRDPPSRGPLERAARRSYSRQGLFWVLPLTYFYLPKSARAHLFPQSVKIHEIRSDPISADPSCPFPTRASDLRRGCSTYLRTDIKDIWTYLQLIQGHHGIIAISLSCYSIELLVYP